MIITEGWWNEINVVEVGWWTEIMYNVFFSAHNEIHIIIDKFNVQKGYQEMSGHTKHTYSKFMVFVKALILPPLVVWCVTKLSIILNVPEMFFFFMDVLDMLDWADCWNLKCSSRHFMVKIPFLNTSNLHSSVTTPTLWITIYKDQNNLNVCHYLGIEHIPSSYIRPWHYY